MQGRLATYSLFSIVVLTAACGNLSQTAVNAMMSAIVGEFGIGVELGQWLTTGYMLVLGVTVPAVTWMARRFSTRQHVLIGLACLLAGALLCLLAPNFPCLFAGRVLQAVSTGMLLPLMQNVAITSFPPGKQATAMGIGGVAMGFAPNIGPTIGGVMVDMWGWRSFFLLLALLGLVLLACALALIRPGSALDRAARLDALSLALSTLGFGGLLLGLSNASSFSAADARIWAPALVGSACLFAFVRRQRRIENPLISMDIFKNRQYIDGFVVLNLLFASFMGVTLVVPLYVEGLCSGTALEAGMVLLPGTVAALVLNPLAGVLTDRFGPRRVCTAGGAALAAGACAMVLLDGASPLWMAVVFQGVRACGVSTLIGPLSQWCLADLPRPLVPHGSSFSIATRQAFASLGTSAMVLLIAVGKGLTDASAGVSDVASGAASDAATLAAAGLTSPAVSTFAAALPYHLAFAFSALAALATFAVILRRVR